MNKNAIVSLLSAICIVPAVQAAGNGSINFGGKLVNQTCNVTINGANDTTLVLPAVQASTLSTNGSVAGEVQFTMIMTDCNKPSVSGSGSVKAFFESGPNVDNNGRLINTVSESNGGASNVVLELTDYALRKTIKIGDKSQAPSNSSGGYAIIVEKDGSATRNYSVRYYATGEASAGILKTSVTYSLVYW